MLLSLSTYSLRLACKASNASGSSEYSLFDLLKSQFMPFAIGDRHREISTKYL
jgi:hypothetical protein